MLFFKAPGVIPINSQTDSRAALLGAQALAAVLCLYMTECTRPSLGVFVTEICVYLSAGRDPLLC